MIIGHAEHDINIETSRDTGSCLVSRLNVDEVRECLAE